MQAKVQTINEDRGARRAADLRRRFRHVSDTAIASPRYGRGFGIQSHSAVHAKSRQAQFQELMAWSMLAIVLTFIGFLVF